jgi:hypothetical protein
MLKLGMVALTGEIPALTWNTPEGRDQLGVIAGTRSYSRKLALS